MPNAKPGSSNAANVDQGQNNNALGAGAALPPIGDSIDVFNMLGWKNDVDRGAADKFFYDGFNPEIIYNIIRKKCPDQGVRVRDVSLMVVIFLMRGNNVGRIVDTVSAEGATMIRSLVAKYGIKSRVDKNSRRDCITLSRVANTLPGFAMKAMVTLHTTHMQPQKAEMGAIHCLLRTSCCIGYFTMEYAAHVYWISLACSVIQGSIIGGQKDTLGTLKKYIHASQTAKRPSEKETVAIMDSLFLKDAPSNWEPLTSELGMEWDGATLKAIAPKILTILAGILPPATWDPFIQPSFRSSNSTLVTG